MITIKNPKILKWLKYVLSAILSLIILVIIIGGLLFTFYISSAPKLSEAQLKSTNSSLVYDGNNNLIADLGSEKRENVTADSIPINLVNAITSIEDKRFFNHRGVDLYRIFGAAFHNLTSQTTQGGSTLDQQLIKLAYFSTNESDQTLKRKAQEVWLALQMERKYTKQEILTFYINKVYMGNGNYGMLTAAKSYYGKDLKDLSYAQLALLAGIPQAPSQYDPYLHPEAAQNRRNVVLQQMYMEKHLTKAEYETAIATPVAEGLQSLQQRSTYPKYMDNYLKQVIEEVKKETNKDIFTAGLKVYTNIIPDAQQALYNIYHSGDYVYYPDQDFQVASTIVDVTNGHVIAQLGGRNQDENVSFGTNQAVLTDRDWGSTMKPITAYAPAIESGVYTSTAQSTNDSVYYWPGTTTQLFNWDLRYNGWMTIQAAIMLSRNVPAVRALEAAGLDYARSFLSSLGINYPEMHYSNAISSNNSSSDKKYGASSEKMAAAYAAFANGGIYHKPRYVNKVEFSDGTSKTFDEKGKRAMKETTAYMMTDMLKTVLTYGTGTAAAIPGVAQAGKTGTSNYTDEELAKIGEKYGLYPDYVGTLAPDENFVGFTKRYAMAVWTGYKNRLTPVYGSSLEIASDVYRSMMTYLTNGYSEDWTMPNGLYRSGGFLYLSGTYASNTDYTNSVYNNLYSNNTTTASSQTTSDDTSSSNDTSNSTNTDNNSNHPSTDDKKTTH
ncbi:TPA: penicillin-binding protein PBP1A [Streptococcus pyogenes]|nr:penicillin-binding protein [Streptococcus pyogenes]HEQ5217614.1 penicillin-binding protein [Streptococcus pyogenes]HEQ9103313.1 penicillin-binding protein [Streptococcus pyogenes]HER0013734.1 penicillin-binding protein [Streptococcus pyogenes]HES7023370.1 penicillin-binding protein [Streptococcus pyogenes]